MYENFPSDDDEPQHYKFKVLTLLHYKRIQVLFVQSQIVNLWECEDRSAQETGGRSRGGKRGRNRSPADGNPNANINWGRSPASAYSRTRP
ncbi:hypothetical protein EVAR_43118_1 [Eumeta japonica]|uniref:Uncharacterized protein n=1 Tax=Eumeta variegata TaxID=151549 RepID=A0A4C1XMK2_EUMVA|nr:hypothetical protein EVAR_43118_1 [Eumeta japonica]